MADCKYKDEITCPYCGYEFSDSWESGDNGTEECPECEKEFEWSAEKTVEYSSYCTDENHEYEHTPTSRIPDCYTCKHCENCQFKDHIIARLPEYEARAEQLRLEGKDNDYLNRVIARDKAILAKLV